MNNKIKASHKVIADHLRSSAFLIADGVLPSNEGRGYVLRRIMRRAMRHAHFLGIKGAVMHKLVPVLIAKMGDNFGELKRAESLITQTLKIEEERFHQTLGSGLEILNDELKKMESMTRGSQIENKFSGKVAFKLHDTYGFPLDLTEDILKEKNIEVDVEGFNLEMEIQKNRGKESWSGSGALKEDESFFEVKEKFGETKFLGYETTKSSAKILKLVNDSSGKISAIILDQTPFYGTSGGQVGDNGILQSGSNIATILETKKISGIFVHYILEIKGDFKVGDEVLAIVDEKNRSARAANHSATHLLHFALKKILGDHVTQKGSKVDVKDFTFDFNHNQPVTSAELEKIEDMVNFYIRQNTEVKTEILDIEKAREKGAVALFGEKYDDVVRVLSMAKDGDQDLSVEFCGGTHAKRTGDIGLFKIVSEKGIAAGIRRITAVSGEMAIEHLKLEQQKLEKEVANFKEQLKQKDKEIEKLKKEKLSGGSVDFKVEKIGEINLISHFFENVEAKDLRELTTQVKSKKENQAQTVILFFGAFEGKIAVCLSISADLHKRLGAGKLIGQIVEKIGGKGGGGKDDFAMGGGTDKAGIESAITVLKEKLK